MSIQIQASNASIEADGDFCDALAFIKSLPGRTFDGARKIWIVPMTTTEIYAAYEAKGYNVDGYPTFRLAAEMPGGLNTLRHANSWLNEAIRELMPNAPRAAIAVANIIRDGELDEAMEDGRVQFSSEERKAAVLEIAVEYFQRIETGK